MNTITELKWLLYVRTQYEYDVYVRMEIMVLETIYTEIQSTRKRDPMKPILEYQKEYIE